MNRLATVVAAAAALALPSFAGGYLANKDVNPNSEGNQGYRLDQIMLKNSIENRSKQLGISKEQLLAKDKADATALAQSMRIGCEVQSGQLLLESEETVDGKKIKAQTYEVACANGIGYFLISREAPGASSATTCFAANAAHDLDVAQKKREPAAACIVAENQDLKAMAANILRIRGKACTVREVKWRGISANAAFDFTEIACDNDTGYILASALKPTTSGLRIVDCKDAAAQGLACKLTVVEQKTVTLDTFKQELAKHAVACDASEVRSIGKETVQKRHVVEFRCSQHPEGLIAFIPLDDSKAPFETMDCATAAKKGVVCKLTPTK